MSEARAAGTIYDLGYQGYAGERLGRSNAMWRLLQYSFRAAFGIGRGQRARLVPFIILLVVFIPVIGQIAIASLSGRLEMINFAQYFEFTAFLVALFTAAQAPELVVPDRKNGVLALYLSRPLRGTDYALAKLGAIVLAMLVLTLVPQLALWIGRVVLPPDAWVAFKLEYPKLLPIVGGTLGTALYMGSIGLAIASFCSRRAFANAAIIAYFLLFPAAVSIIHRLVTGDAKRFIVLAHPVWLLTGFSNWLFDIEAKRRTAIGRAELPGTAYLWTMIGVAAFFTALLLWRYRRSET
jgi:ABC-2 type transport system permease protein